VSKHLIHEKESQAARLVVFDGDSPEDVKNFSSVLNALVTDAFALYLKTKNFHWHMSGQHFRDYHLLLDEHAAQIFGITDALAERVRKVGGNNHPLQTHCPAATDCGQRRGFLGPNRDAAGTPR
jgi:DNA-binding ferritin-like protein